MNDSSPHLFRIETSYTEIKLIEFAIKTHRGVIRSSAFTDRIRYDVAIPADAVELFVHDMEQYGKNRIHLERMGDEWPAK